MHGRKSEKNTYMHDHSHLYIATRIYRQSLYNCPANVESCNLTLPPPPTTFQLCWGNYIVVIIIIQAWKFIYEVRLSQSHNVLTHNSYCIVGHLDYIVGTSSRDKLYIDHPYPGAL